MNQEDLNLIIQLVYSMKLASEELEKAIEKQDVERVKKLKSEITNFQKQISEIVKKWH